LINFDHAETKFLAWTRQMVCVSFCQNESDEITMAARIGATADWAAPRKRPAKRRRHTAYHEASHAVIGRVLTLYCEGATIKPDYVAREKPGTPFAGTIGTAFTNGICAGRSAITLMPSGTLE
jgi:hypothetical protein